MNITSRWLRMNGFEVEMCWKSLFAWLCSKEVNQNNSRSRVPLIFNRGNDFSFYFSTHFRQSFSWKFGSLRTVLKFEFFLLKRILFYFECKLWFGGLFLLLMLKNFGIRFQRPLEKHYISNSKWQWNILQMKSFKII